MSISLPTEHIQKFTRTYEVTAMFYGPHTTPAELLAFAPNFRPAVWMPEARGWLISRGDTGVMWVDPDQFEREFTPTPEKRETDEHPSTQGTEESGRQVRPDTEGADEVHPDEASDDAAPPRAALDWVESIAARTRPVGPGTIANSMMKKRGR
jgi:hypothetical protein